MTIDTQTTSRPAAAGPGDDVIYIGDVILFYLRRWPLFLAVCGATVALAVAYVLLSTPVYKASATLAPPSSSGNGGKASALNLPFGLGAALGDGGGSTMHKQFLQTITSYDIAVRLAADKAMAERIVQPDDPGTAITPGLMGDKLKSLLSVNKLRNTPLEDTTFTEISFRHEDPAFAVQALQRIFALSDDIIRTQVRETKTAQRDALLRSLELTSNAYQREALVKNLLEVEHELMTSMTDAPFSYRVIESLHAGEHPVAPRRVLAVAGALVAGGLIAFALASIQLFNAYRRNRGRILA
ncbi:Wzz/FepE/Etk N-terminal domain-containing protein [Niveispirillum fermenti]|uniref:Wzz/FepE/Etk N-terminal domain-containing protein n=1 Tax=Niveispirillum fermenti TaxID=1233113 RepID=UPI003A885698